jgi:hypothetical protein
MRGEREESERRAPSGPVLVGRRQERERLGSLIVSTRPRWLAAEIAVPRSVD